MIILLSYTNIKKLPHLNGCGSLFSTLGMSIV